MKSNNKIKIDDRFILDQNKSLEKCIITDFDGTISLMNGRIVYDYTKVDTDLPNQNVINIINDLSNSHKIIIVTGREESCRNLCVSWLEKHNVKYDELFMRKTKDFRGDEIIKKEIYESKIKDKYYVTAVYDDRNRVCDFWRSIGLLCCQVYYGDF